MSETKQDSQTLWNIMKLTKKAAKDSGLVKNRRTKLQPVSEKYEVK